MTLKLHNTPTDKDEEFTPLHDNEVMLYTCGPTVYNFLTVGNWTAYIYWDTLVRTLRADGYDVTRVMNITDVGHLTSDADEGEDKLEKGAKREGKTAWDIARFYTDDFLDGMKKLNMIMPDYLPRATEYITQQLDLIRKLKEKGYTYQIDDGIYFNTSKFPDYAKFAHLDLEAQKAGARVEYNLEKRNPSDFALWKFTPAGEMRDMEWETPADLLDSRSPLPSSPLRDGFAPGLKSGPGTASDLGLQISRNDDEGAARHLQSKSLSDSSREEPSISSTLPETVKSDRIGRTSVERSVRTASGSSTEKSALAKYDEVVGEQENKVMGFPGWHLECSAMAMDLLGPTIDIHTGGIDHIPVHHTNEIAQSEAATGQQFSHYWLHCNHLKVNGTKISKSLGNGYTLQDLEQRGFSPLDFRMFVLQGHYSHEGNFTFENLEAARNRRQNWRAVAALRWQARGEGDNEELTKTSERIVAALNDNLNTPEALRIIDDTFDRIGVQPLDQLSNKALDSLLTTIDQLLGLRLLESTPDISAEIKQLIGKREETRTAKDWQRADQLRDELQAKGIAIRDTANGSIWEYN